MIIGPGEAWVAPVGRCAVGEVTMRLTGETRQSRHKSLPLIDETTATHCCHFGCVSQLSLLSLGLWHTADTWAAGQCCHWGCVSLLSLLSVGMCVTAVTEALAHCCHLGCGSLLSLVLWITAVT